MNNFNSVTPLFPAVIQDADTRTVLMLGYVNEASLAMTRELGKVTFWSRSKGRLWTKGETSGHFLTLVDIQTDCDQDSYLILARPRGSACHTGSNSCFGDPTPPGFDLRQLENIILSRKNNPSPTSYTSSLFAAGIDRMAQKVGEEGVETVIAAKNEDEAAFLGEMADLFFHSLVLLAAKGKSLQDVADVLQERHEKKKKVE